MLHLVALIYIGISSVLAQTLESTGTLLEVGRDRSQDTRGLFKDVVNGALYLAGTRVLGQNVTNNLIPLTRPLVDRFVPDQPIRIDEGRIVVNLNPNVEDKTDRPQSAASPGAEHRACTTPQGTTGTCRDLSDCPQLLLDLTNLRSSICFQELFVPGVCCPRDLLTPSVALPTTRPRPKPQPATPPPFQVPQHHHQRPPPALVQTTPNRTQTPPQNNFPCGQIQSPELRVVGGDSSTPGQWPWMVAIYLHGNGRKEFWCGGTLISPQHVLTAAHCTKDSNGKSFHLRQFSFLLGDYDLSTNTDFTRPVTYRAIEYSAHPRFQKNGFYNDIAIFKLSSPAELNEFVIPVCLPSQIEGSPLDSLVGRTPSVVGWGTTFYGGDESSILRHAELPVWRQRDCDEVYFQPIGDMFLCAGYASGGKDACQGDSGGPLVLYDNNYWMQIGIVSFGNRCARPGYPGVYTRLTKFLPWIRQVMLN